MSDWKPGPFGRHWHPAGWTVRRAPSFKVENGKVTKRYWLYHKGSRFTPTGRFEDAVSFATEREAMDYAEAREERR